jgi:hypothetical protein
LQKKGTPCSCVGEACAAHRTSGGKRCGAAAPAPPRGTEDATAGRFRLRIAAVNGSQRYAPAPVNMPRCHRDGVVITPRG